MVALTGPSVALVRCKLLVLGLLSFLGLTITGPRNIGLGESGYNGRISLYLLLFDGAFLKLTLSILLNVNILCNIRHVLDTIDQKNLVPL